MDTTKRTRGIPRMTHNMIFSDDYTTALPICLAANRGGNSQTIKQLHRLWMCFLRIFQWQR